MEFTDESIMLNLMTLRIMAIKIRLIMLYQKSKRNEKKLISNLILKIGIPTIIITKNYEDCCFYKEGLHTAYTEKCKKIIECSCHEDFPCISSDRNQTK